MQMRLLYPTCSKVRNFPANRFCLTDATFWNLQHSHLRLLTHTHIILQTKSQRALSLCHAPYSTQTTPYQTKRSKMGNGAKAQQKRDRNAKDDKKAGSQLKSVCIPSHMAHNAQPCLSLHSSSDNLSLRNSDQFPTRTPQPNPSNAKSVSRTSSVPWRGPR